MKKIFAFIIIIALLLAPGCKEETAVVDVLSSAQSQDGAIDVTAVSPGESPQAEEAAEQVPPGTVSFDVTDTVAYVLSCAQGATLYGAIEYENTGTAPMRVTSATFVFSAGGTSLTKTFVPMLNEYDIVNAGQSSYLAIWSPEAELEAGAPAALESVQLVCERADATRKPLSVGDIYLADNYPGFSTLSGTITNLSDSVLDFCVVNAGFYDEAGKLLGVWYFTKNVSLEPRADKPFVVQMTELPIPGLAELADSAKGVGFGFN